MVEALAAVLLGGAAAAWGGEPLVSYRVVGDAIPVPLSQTPGDPARGKEVALNREGGGCILCHAVTDPAARFAGNIAQPLNGIAARLSEGQLRLRVVDSTRVNPKTVMPSYYRIEGLNRVAEAYRGKPILTAQQIEDVVAYLQTLQ